MFYSVSEIYGSFLVQTSYANEDENRINDTDYLTFEYNMPCDLFICINGLDVSRKAVGNWLTKWDKADNIDYHLVVNEIIQPAKGQCYYKNLTSAKGGNYTLPAPSYDMKDNETFASYGYMIALKLHPIIPPLDPIYEDDMDNVKFFLYFLQFGIPLFIFMLLSVCFVSKRIVYIFIINYYYIIYTLFSFSFSSSYCYYYYHINRVISLNTLNQC